jgi:hypothetical protein
VQSDYTYNAYFLSDFAQIWELSVSPLEHTQIWCVHTFGAYLEITENTLETSIMKLPSALIFQYYLVFHGLGLGSVFTFVPNVVFMLDKPFEAGKFRKPFSFLRNRENGDQEKTIVTQVF